MRVDFSEPECCSTCYRLRTSGVLTTQESEPPSNATVSVTSTPVTVQDLGHESGPAASALVVSPVEALGHDSPVVVSTLSPVHTSSSFRFEPASASSSSASTPALGQTFFGSDGESAAPKEFTFAESKQVPSFANSGGLFANPGPSSTFGQNQGPAFGFGFESAASKPSEFGSGTNQSSDFGFGGESAAPKPSSTFGSYQTPAFGFGGESATTKPSTFGSYQSPAFGFGGESANPGPSSTFWQNQVPAFGFGSNQASASGPGGLLGTRNGFGQTLSASTPTTLGDYVTSAVPTVGYSPSSSTCNFFRQTPPTTTSAVSFSSVSGPASLFGNDVASARPDIGSQASSSSHFSGPNPSTSTVVFGTTPVSVSSLFGPAQHPPKATSVNASSCFPGFGVGYLPGSSSDLFGPKPLFERYPAASAHDSISAGFTTSPPQCFGFSTASTHAPSSSSLSRSSPSFTSQLSASHLPSSSPSSPATLFSSNPILTSQLSASHEQGSRLTRYMPTLVDHQPYPYVENRLMFNSISASNVYQHKSHEELRWEDYNRGDKGGSLPAANISPIGRNFDSWVLPAGVATSSSSSPRPFGFSTATTQLPSSSSSSSATFSSSPNCEYHVQGSRLIRYAATPSGEKPGEMLDSISASPFYRHKSHDELRWEDYNQGDKGASLAASSLNTASQPAFNTFPAGGTTPLSSPFGQTNSTFTGSAFSFPAGVATSPSSPFGQTPAGLTSFYGPFGQTMFPSTFASSYSTVPAACMPPTIWGAPQPLFSQRPYEAATVSSPASGCTACGAATSSSAAGHFNFNGATTPPSAATTLYGSYPVMLGTTFVAYPAQNFILLPFSAMRLQ